MTKTFTSPLDPDSAPKVDRKAEGPHSSDDGFAVWLYGPDQDGPVQIGPGPTDPGDDEMLWVDLDVDHVDDARPLLEELGIGDVDPRLEERPAIVHHDGYLEVWVRILGTDSTPSTLHCVVGPNWVVTFHEDGLDLVNEFNEPFHGETKLGELNGPAFLALVLDWQVTGYIRVVEELQSDIDRLDEKLLTTSPEESALIERLYELRRRVRNLRATFSPHREIFALLANPRSQAVVGVDASDDYQRLEERLQNAIGGVDTAREMIVGSFDVFMTRTAQQTNEIMKRLTIISILLLPAGVIAGVMGMNFQVALFDWAWMFWVVVGVMAALAGITLTVAKRRGWM